MDERYHAAYPTLYREHWWWRAREEMLLAMVGRFVAGVPRPRMLDVGCGAGLFFDALARFGEVEGIESEAEAVARSGRWRPHIRVGVLDERTEVEVPFDLILMLDVLEHVRSPEVVLRHARRLLAPGGRVLVTVPAFRWLWTQHDVLNQHVTRYSAAQLRALIESAGLRPQESGYLFQSLVAGKLLVRGLEWLRPGAPGVPAVPPGWLNRALRAWCSLEHRLLGWLPFGGSAWVVATAPPDSVRGAGEADVTSAGVI